MRRTPEHDVRGSHCNTAGSFQICFLRACVVVGKAHGHHVGKALHSVAYPRT